MKIQTRYQLRNTGLLSLLLIAWSLQTILAAPAPFPLERGEVVVTSFSTLDPNGGNVTVIDTRPPIGPLGANWLAPRFRDNAWNVQNLGEVFGVCLDASDPPNIYVTATSVYGPAAFGPAGSGGVYKIDGVSGAVSVFSALPAGPASLGNICYDSVHNQFFVSHLDNGLIYCLDANGAQIGTPFDHGVIGRPNENLTPIADSGTSGLTAAGRRIWGVQVSSNRLYYAVWVGDESNANSGGPINQIWSIGLDANGSFNLGSAANGGPKLEIALPYLPNRFWSSPVSSIAFSKTGKMLLAERTAVTSANGLSYGGTTSMYAHAARVLEYEPAGSSWADFGVRYWIGDYLLGFNEPYNAAGGADYDCRDAVVATGDALIHSNGVEVYGLQILPPGGNTVPNRINTSYLIDLDGITSSSADKSHIGDVVVYREKCECLEIHCPANKVVSCESAWDFDSPVSAGCTNYTVSFTTETNGVCPTLYTRAWSISDALGNMSSCAQTVTVWPALTFLTPTRDSSAASTYASPFGSGQISVNLAAGSGISGVQNDPALWNSQFPTLFPNANNNWSSDAQSVRIVGTGNFTISIDLSQFHNLSPGFVFGFYNIRDEGTYSVAAYDSSNVQIPFPLSWHLIGNDDDTLHPQANTHLNLDLSTGIFSTQVYQPGVQSDAAFWNQLPANTAKITITAALQQVQNNADGVAIFFAEPAPLQLACVVDKTVALGEVWAFDPPAVTNGCGHLISTNVTTTTNGVCPQIFTRTWLVTDACGNSATCSQTVIVECKTTNCIPVVSRVADLSLQCAGDAGATVAFPQPHVSSCCPGPYQFTYDPPAGIFPIGVTPVVGTVTDGCGNSAEFHFSVTVTGHGFLPVGKWAIRDGGDGSQNANAVAVDRFGNSFIAGAFVEQALLGSVALSAPILTDGFLAKYDTFGAPLWAVKLGGPRGDEAFGVALDPQGNCFVTGVFFETATFYSAGSSSGVTINGFGENDIFLAKYDPAGQLLWVVPAGGAGPDSSVGVATDGAGNAFITGAFISSATFPSAPPSSAAASITGNGIRDCFLAKFSPAGEVLWVDASQGSGSYMAVSRGVAASALGDAWIVGEFNGAPQFGANPALGAFGNDNAFIARHGSSASSWQWARQTSCGNVCGNHDGRAVGVDAAGNCYFVAYYSGDAKLGAQGPVSSANGLSLYDTLIGSLGPNGAPRWLNNGLPFAATDQEPRAIAVTAAGDVFSAGFLNGTGGLIAADGQTVWLARYSSMGANIWRRQGTGQAGNHNLGTGLSLDPAGCVYLTGTFNDSALTFSGFTSSPTLAAPGGEPEIFLTKYCPQCSNDALPIHINTQPTSQIVAPGEEARFAVIAEADSPLSFQWQLNGKPLPGATNAIFAIAKVSAEDVGLYTVIVSTDALSIASIPAALMLPTSFTINLDATGRLRINWPADQNWILEEAPTITGPWAASVSQENPLLFKSGPENRFFRLQQPAFPF